MKIPFAQLHGPLFIVSVFATLCLARLLSLAIPTDFYFTFQSLFSDRSPHDLMWSLVGKMAAPLLIGMAAGHWCIAEWHGAAGPRHVAETARPGFARRVRSLFGPTVFAAGFFAAFLAAWPAMVYWDLMTNPAVAHLKLAFFGLYVLYMLGFGYVSLLGMLLAIYLREHWQGGPPGSESVSMKELSRVGGLWLVNSGLAAGAMKLLTS